MDAGFTRFVDFTADVHTVPMSTVRGSVFPNSTVHSGQVRLAAHLKINQQLFPFLANLPCLYACKLSFDG